jgi:hypothetical protein
MEGPALNQLADSKELINYADRVVAIFSSDAELKPIDKESIAYLNNLNGKLMGAVLNQVDISEMIS